jgi:hypothetical protein
MNCIMMIFIIYSLQKCYFGHEIKVKEKRWTDSAYKMDGR